MALNRRAFLTDLGFVAAPAVLRLPLDLGFVAAPAVLRLPLDFTPRGIIVPRGIYMDMLGNLMANGCERYSFQLEVWGTWAVSYPQQNH